MQFRTALLGAAMAALTATSASALRISHDAGGQIGPYMATYASLRSSGEQIVIDGPCLSACTMLLGIIPRENICVTPRARLGFHAAWKPDDNGNPVTHVGATKVLWEIYPQNVRSWLSRHGGLQRKMVFLHGRELSAMYQPCH